MRGTAPSGCRRAARGRHAQPATIADITHASAEAARALDAYLRRYGHRVLSWSDVDAPTLVEQPALIVASVVAAMDRGSDPATVVELIGPRSSNWPTNSAAAFRSMSKPDSTKR